MADGVTGSSYSSKSLLWMTLGLFFAMGVLLGGAFFLGGRAMRSAGLVSAKDGKNAHTPLGSLRIEREKELGPTLPLYPNGTLVIPDQHEALKQAQEARSGITRTLYQADDDPDLVDHWYQDHLTAEFKRRGPGESLMPDVFKQLNISDSTVAFLADRKGLIRVVTLVPDSRGVQITLIRYDLPGAASAADDSSGTAAPPADSSAPNSAAPQTQQAPSQP